LAKNKLINLPVSILKIKDKLIILETSYEINNLDIESEILIFYSLRISLENLPINLKEIWVKKINNNINIKLPLNCELKYF
jgi:hypothetical protein